MDLFTRSLEAEPDEVLIRLDAPMPRRLVATVSLSMLGAMVIWLGIVERVEAGIGLAPLLLGAAGLYLAFRLWRSSRTVLELTPTELRERDGRQIARVADIVAVERGVFGFFKPANGFVLVTREKSPAAISPGVWWRVGKRVGVGGLTGAGAGKAMGELLGEMLKLREGKSSIGAIQELFRQNHRE